MSRSLLDTNIISNATKPRPSESLVASMAEQPDEDLFISTMTVAEIRRGILEEPSGKKRRELERWFSGPEGPQTLFAGRWDGERTSTKSARHDHCRNRRANNCVIVTENVTHFAGLKAFNPMRGE